MRRYVSVLILRQYRLRKAQSPIPGQYRFKPYERNPITLYWLPYRKPLYIKLIVQRQIELFWVLLESLFIVKSSWQTNYECLEDYIESFLVLLKKEKLCNRSPKTEFSNVDHLIFLIKKRVKTVAWRSLWTRLKKKALTRYCRTLAAWNTAKNPWQVDETRYTEAE